jgi:hypothetical protein
VAGVAGVLDMLHQTDGPAKTIKIELAGSGLSCRIFKKFLHQEWMRGPSAVLAPEAGIQLLRSAGAIIQKFTPIHQQMGLLRASPPSATHCNTSGQVVDGKTREIAPTPKQLRHSYSVHRRKLA